MFQITNQYWLVHNPQAQKILPHLGMEVPWASVSRAPWVAA